jgi:beta-galactosidase
MGSFPEHRPDWSNLSVLHRNTLPPRANFKIFTSESEALARDESKARVHSLAGTWKFHLASNPFEAPEGFEVADFDKSQWSDIPVPSMWQLQGFGKGPVYTNVAFPIFVDPPHAPFDDNECGSYVTSFTVPKHLEDDQLRLRFEGVDSAYHVWVNGKQVGYSQGSRNPAEFDITEYIKRGEENVLAVRVYQFCDATYIEDQDQWRMSGIFRDVFLLGFPKTTHFQDFSVQTIFDKSYENATLEVQVDVQGQCSVDLKLLDAEQQQVATDTQTAKDSGTVKFSVPVSTPHKWTAETPYLYQLVLSLGDDQFVTHRVGFRQVELKDGLIKVNGQRIVIKGANRHEHHPVHGRTVPYEFMKQDLLLMKTHNINAIRSCHQPSDPRLYDLADEMGFWVMVSSPEQRSSNCRQSTRTDVYPRMKQTSNATASKPSPMRHSLLPRGRCRSLTVSNSQKPTQLNGRATTQTGTTRTSTEPYSSCIATNYTPQSSCGVSATRHFTAATM